VEVIQWWAPIAWLLLAAAVVAAVVLIRRRRAKADAASLPVANTDRLTGLDSYRRAIARYRLLISLIAVAVIVLLAAAAGLTARFSTTTSYQPDLRNRDIVLCLDVSGSMVDYDARVVDVFADLATRFEGERLSLVVFNASAVTYFPLTSDYDYIISQFDTLQSEFTSGTDDFYAGTLIGNGSSLVGDGLASCVTRFDALDQERSRSVVLVTDNLVAGAPIFTLPEASDLAKDRSVRVYGINPGDTTAKGYLESLAIEFQDAVENTGGGYYALDDPGTIPTIVDSITAEQAALSKGPVQYIHDDQPGAWVWLALLGLGALFVVGWRLGR